MNLKQSELSKQADLNCGVALFPLADIYADNDFNTRDEVITPGDVYELARSINEQGLIEPIAIRPYGALDTDTKSDKPYTIVAGFRRYMAYDVMEAEKIPAILKVGLSAFGYKSLNVIENLQRKNLNLMEEAHCIEHYINAGWTLESIAQEIGKPISWVQLRSIVLSMPREIHADIAKGSFTQQQIQRLYKFRDNKGKQLEFARTIKEHTEKGSKISIRDLDKQAPKASSKTQRSKGEIQDMMALYRDAFGYDITLRLLAWTTGEVSNLEMFMELKQRAKEQGKVFVIPAMR